MNEQRSLEEEILGSAVPYTMSMTIVGCCISPIVVLWFVYNFLRYDILIFLLLIMSLYSVPQAIQFRNTSAFCSSAGKGSVKCSHPRADTENLSSNIPSVQFSVSTTSIVCILANLLSSLQHLSYPYLL